MLVRSFEMLVPAATDADLIARFHMTEGSWGFGLIKMQLIERCVLSIYKLLADGDDTNPSLLTLVRPFLRGNRKRYAELFEILRSDYSDWHKTISEEERRTRPAWEIAMFEQADEEDAAKARAEFDARADAIAADWPRLVEVSNIIAPVRGKWVAHRELEYDPVTKKYKDGPSAVGQRGVRDNRPRRANHHRFGDALVGVVPKPRNRSRRRSKFC
jgi:hypothetical protein